MHDFVGLWRPFLWAVHMHPVSFRYEFLCALVSEKPQVSKRRFAAEVTIIIADFVLQDSAEPAAHGRSATKPFLCSYRRQECFLHQILRDIGLAYPLKCTSVKNVAMFIDPSRRVICGNRRILFDICFTNSSRNSFGLKRHAAN